MPAPPDPKRPPVREVLAAAVEALGGQERPGPGRDGRGRRRRDGATGGTCSSRPAPAPASRSAYLVPGAAPRPAGSSSRPRPSRCSTSSSSATSRGSSRPSSASPPRGRRVVRRAQGALQLRLPAPRSARACPTTRAPWSRCPRARSGKKVLELRDVGRGGGRGRGAAASATTRRATPTASGARSASPTASAWARPGAPSARSASPSGPARRRTRSHLIVTNHSLLAIDAIEGVPMIPDYDVVVDRRGPRARQPGDPGGDRRAVRRRGRPGRAALPAPRRGERPSRPTTSPTPATRCAAAIAEAEPGRIDTVPEALADALVAGARRGPRLRLGLPQGGRRLGEADAGRDPGARGRAGACSSTAERMAAGSETDVLWLTERERTAAAPRLCVAPLEVWGPMREKLLTDKTVVFTSATLMLGGDFDAVATSVGLKPAERVDVVVAPRCRWPTGRPARRCVDDVLPWVGLDVGSPFDYAPPGDPLRRPPPAAAGARRARGGPARRDRRAGRRGRGPHARALQLAPGGRDRGRGGARAAAPPDHAGPGRRPAARARPAVRRRPAHLPVRHPQPLAGPRRPRRHLPAGADRPDPVPAARRPADERAPARGRPGGRQRLHAGRRHPRRAAAGAGHRPADPDHRPTAAWSRSSTRGWRRLATAASCKASLPPMWTTYDGDLVRQALTRLASEAT